MTDTSFSHPLTPAIQPATDMPVSSQRHPEQAMSKQVALTEEAPEPRENITKWTKKGLERIKLRVTPKNPDLLAFLASRKGSEHPALNFTPESGVVVDTKESAICIDTLEREVEQAVDSGDEAQEQTPEQLEDEGLAKLYEECSNAHKQYQSVLSECLGHESGTPQHTILTPVETSNKTRTFEQVEADIKSAFNSLSDVAGARQDKLGQKTLAGRLHRAFAGFQSRADDVKSFASLLPDTFGIGSSVCGGLSVLLDAAGRYSMWDENFVRALEKIKATMVDRAYAYETHPPSPQMHTSMSKLFASIFSVLELLVQWVFTHPVSRAFEALIRPKTYGQALEARLATMDVRAAELKECSKNYEVMILKGKIDSLNHTTSGISDDMKKSLVKLTGLEERDDEAKDERGMILSKLTALQERVTKAGVCQTIYILLAGDPPLLGGAKSTIAALPPVPGTLKLPQQTNRQSPPVHRPTQPSIDANTIVSVCKPQLEVITKDLRNVMVGCHLDKQGERTVAELSTHIRVRAFIETDVSYILLLEGGIRSRHVPRGPITLLSARVLDILQQVRLNNTSLFTLGYLCSEHRLTRQPFGTAHDMIITLLLQLIDQYRGLDAGLLEEFRDLIRKTKESKDVAGFCSLLRRCVKSLPKNTTLFCVIEGVSFFESPGARFAGTDLIVRQLLQLGREPSSYGEGGGPTVKCLFTAPTKTGTQLRGRFEAYEVFAPYGSDGNSPGMFRQGNWMRGG